MPAQRILLVEDDPAGRELAEFNLEKALVRVKERSPQTPVLVITAYSDVETAVEAMKLGAVDFIGKPFNREHLLLVVERVLESRRLRQEVRSLRSQVRGVERPIVLASQAMQKAVELADRVAGSDVTVLVTGESGTGKELIARRIHGRSDRAGGPFVPANVAAMPAELLESELFGHEKGAFTGATRARKGRFRQAHGGTVFLDEIGEIPAPLQAKLLRVLQERTVEVVGADVPTEVDARIVVATNRDLGNEVAEGRFREDLYFRINVVEIPVPALRERPEDIEPLTSHFVEQFAAGRELAIPDSLLSKLTERSWPGNVRELQNAVQRLVVLCPGDELRAEDLAPVASGAGVDGAALLDGWPTLPDDGLSLVDLEKNVIERVLALKDGNVTQAAAYLGVPRHVLAYRMEKYGIPRK